MLVLPKYEGLDLPVHPQDPEVVEARGYFRPGNYHVTGVSKVVRAAGVTVFGARKGGYTAIRELSLKTILDKTDQELEKVAELCEADVIPNEWGLYPVGELYPHEFERYRLEDGNVPADMPADHILVAEVGVVHNSDVLTYEQERRIESGVVMYSRESGDLQLNDMSRYGQWVTGHCSTGSPLNRSAGIKLVDIEPRLEYC